MKVSGGIRWYHNGYKVYNTDYKYATKDMCLKFKNNQTNPDLKYTIDWCPGPTSTR